MKKVAVVILNYKVKDEVIKCIKSVKQSNYQNLQIIVVDNDSGDDLETEIKNFKDVDFIQSGANLGYSGGNNLGITRALKDKADFVFILNPDTVIDDKCIANCVKAMADETVGIVGPKVLFLNGNSKSRIIWYAGGIFDRKNVIGSHRGVDQKDEGQFDEFEETDFVTGGAMFVRGEVFNKISLFDERYFLYYEDSDFCFRVKKAGFKVMYLPSAVVYHANAKSTGLGSPIQDYYITRNRMLYASKFLPIRTRFALLRQAVRNFPSSARRAALHDFLFRKFGKGEI